MPKKEASEKNKTTKTTKSTKSTKSTKKNIGKDILIIESPTKAKTIKKYFGGKYEVLSSGGHIRDLPSSRLGVDVENEFTPEYIVSRKGGKTAILKELKAAAAGGGKVYLATDPDREGEAIAWHLAQLLNLDTHDNIRITFNEVTKTAVSQAMEAPKAINMNRVSAQQARRVLDRLVGYKLSPFLWKKVKTGLSAGRVQSVATRLIVDREREIEAFVPDEYWVLTAIFEKSKKEWAATFFGKNIDGKDEKVELKSESEMNLLLEDIKEQLYTVKSIKKTERIRQPNPPFITSTLQQDASSRLNMRSQRTMSIAQSLYEGVDIKGRGMFGLITYMRTDSLRISDEARISAEAFIKEKYGEENYPPQPRVFKTRASAQDAHEAIRPTDINLTPEDIKESVAPEQYRLYKLIWERFVASQMAAAKYQITSVEVCVDGKNSGDSFIFRASDSKIAFPGFMTVYSLSDDEEKAGKRLPDLKEGDSPNLKTLVPEQKFTQPPSRYTEASLIKTFEENGIARPSTYATIISTILERRYVEKEGKSFLPTTLGFITTDLMKENFQNIVDVAFTAGMESKLDEIEEGEKTYLETMNEFYGDFSNSLKEAESKLEGVKIEVPNEESDVICEKCGANMVYKMSKFGRFLACPNYPECKNAKPIIVESDGFCPVCGGKILVRRSKTGRTFYACEKSPECKFITWDVPVKDICPNCGKTMFKHGSKLTCLAEECGGLSTKD